jgi:hypothetical protein
MAVALLRTCKRIWLETYALPFDSLSTTPMVFAIGWDARRPPGIHSSSTMLCATADKGYVEATGNTPFKVPRSRKLLKHHWDALNSIHLFLQGLTEENLEGFFHGGVSLLEKEIAILPSTLIITVRYSDWLWWESSDPLFLDFATIRLPSSVTRLVMELEMIEARESELKDLLNEVFTHEDAYRWYCKDGEHLRILHPDDPWKYVTTSKRDGPTKFDGQTFHHHPGGDTMPMVVKTVVWERHEEAWEPTDDLDL